MGRYIAIALEAKINDEKYFLVNTYAPNKDSESAKFYDHLINVFKKDDRTFEDKIIVGGDFNCPLNPQMDKKGGIMITRQSIVDRFEEIQSVFNLHDIWRVKNPNLKSLRGRRSLLLSFVDSITGLYQMLSSTWLKM